MTTTGPDATRLELAIAALGGRLDAFMERVGGQLDLLVHRASVSDQRHAELAGLIARLDERMDAADRERATRVEVAELRLWVEAQLRAAAEAAAADRRVARGALLSGLSSFVVAVLLLIITVAVRQGGA